MIKLELTQKEVDLITAGLGELKASAVYNLLVKIANAAAEHRAETEEKSE